MDLFGRKRQKRNDVYQRFPPIAELDRCYAGPGILIVVGLGIVMESGSDEEAHVSPFGWTPPGSEVMAVAQIPVDHERVLGWKRGRFTAPILCPMHADARVGHADNGDVLISCSAPGPFFGPVERAVVAFHPHSRFALAFTTPTADFLQLRRSAPLTQADLDHYRWAEDEVSHFAANAYW